MSEPAGRRVWRLIKERHVENAFDGEGARLYGGRWNSPGRRVVYTSSSLALAALETLVHLDPAMPLPRFIAFSTFLDAADIATATVKVPQSYAIPSGCLPDMTTTRRIGDQWLAAGTHLALAVPSAIVPQEVNFLLNPLHPAFPKLTISPPVAFSVDARLRHHASPV